MIPTFRNALIALKSSTLDIRKDHCVLALTTDEKILHPPTSQLGYKPKLNRRKIGDSAYPR